MVVDKADPQGGGPGVRQVMVAHREFLRRVLKGCLLSRRVRLLRALIDLKLLAQRFANISSRICAEPAPSGSDPSSENLTTGVLLKSCNVW